MGETVLLVDDEPNVLQALGRLLRREDYETIRAEGGVAAVEILRNTPGIAVVISDLRMPDLPGLEVLKTCRKIQPDAIRIALTGFCDTQTMMGCMNDAHVNQFLTKPWDDELLRRTIGHAVRMFVQERENQRLQRIVEKQKAKLAQANQSLERKVEERTKSLSSLNRKLSGALTSFFGVLSRIAEINVTGIPGHGKRVAAIANELARKLDLEEKQVFEIAHAAVLHDIGLVFVPKEVLSKPEKEFTREEKAVFERHAVAGYELVRDVPGFGQIAEMIRSHHEWISGAGFPEGLCHDKIPLGARIIAVADYYDQQVYPREKMTIESDVDLSEEMRRVAGTRLDAGIVELFLEDRCEAQGSTPEDEIAITIAQLRPGMILSRSLRTPRGVALVAKETTLDSDMIIHLKESASIDPSATMAYVVTASIHGRGKADGAEQFPNKPVLLVVNQKKHVLHALEQELTTLNVPIRGYTSPMALLADLPKATMLKGVVMDLDLPGIEGDALISLIHTTYPDVECIVLTDQADRKHIQRLLAVGGIRSVFRKPWDREKLIRAVRNLTPCQMKK